MSVVTDVKPSELRRYPFEYAVIALVAYVILLTVRVEKLNAYIRDDLTTQKIEAQATILKNDETIKEFLNSFKK